MSANLKNSAVVIGLEKFSFHSSPKEGQCQRMYKLLHSWGVPGSSAGRESSCNAGDPGLGRSTGFNSWVGKICWRRDRLPTPVFLGFPGGSDGKKTHLQCRRPGINPWVEKIPWTTAWKPTPVFLPGESPWTESLVGYSPWGPKESDMTE